MEEKLIIRIMKKAIYEKKAYLYKIVGNQGVGKTSLAITLMHIIYNDWGKVFRYLYFEPYEFHTAKFYETPYVITFDDAGLWLNKGRWYEKDVKNFTELLNTSRNIANNIIFTTPSDNLPSSIERNMNFEIRVKDECNIKSDRPISCGTLYSVFTNVKGERIKERIGSYVWDKYYKDEVYELYSIMRKIKIDKKRYILGKEESILEEAKNYYEKKQKRIYDLAKILNFSDEDFQEFIRKIEIGLNIKYEY